MWPRRRRRPGSPPAGSPSRTPCRRTPRRRGRPRCRSAPPASRARTSARRGTPPPAAGRPRSRPACRGPTWAVARHAPRRCSAAAPRRRLVGGQRGMPEGSVPIVIRLGSRVTTSDSPDTRRCWPLTFDRSSVTRRAGCGRRPALGPRSPRRPATPATRTRTTTTRRARRRRHLLDVEPRHLTGGWIGPVREVAGVAGAERDRLGLLALVWAPLGGLLAAHLVDVLGGLGVVEQ